MNAEAKPGYKLTEVGMIPTEWVTAALIDICNYADYRGKTPPKSASGVFLVTAKNIKKGFIDYTESQEYVPAELYEDIMRRGAPAAGDLLITTEAPLGNIALVDREDIALAQRVIKYRPKDSRIKTSYLLQCMLHDTFQRLLDEKSSGSTAKGIKGGVLHTLNVAVPPVAEQVAIAEVLSDMDSLISGLNQLIAKKRDIQQATMQQLLTGQRRLPGFSGEWEVKRLGDLCALGMGRTPSRINDTYWGSGYKWLSIADLKGKVVSESSEEVTELAAKQMSLIPKGTLLMSFKLSIGRLAFAGCNLFTNEAICSFNDLKANPEYLYYSLQRVDFSLYGKQAVKGFTLNKASLQLVKVPIPTMEEQGAIALVLSDMDAEVANLEVRRDKARQLKQGMMQELLTGRIRLV